MIIVDTNIISEMMKPFPTPCVINWLDNQKPSQLFITTITIAEITYGIHVLPNGNRRRSLETAFNKTIEEAFEHSILSFNKAAAHCYGKIMAQRKLSGRPLSMADGQIAAITFTHHFTLATRNIRDFVDCEIELINPFKQNNLSVD